MTRVLFGVGVVGMSGSTNRGAGGCTFQKNNIVRNRVIPVQPNTAAQARVRGLTTTLSVNWGTTLTEVERQAWDAAAASGDWDFSDPLTGTMQARTGFNLYVALNSNAAFADNDNSSAIIDTPPVKEAPGTSFVTGITADASAGTVALNFTGTLATNEQHVICVSAPQNPGRMAFRKSKCAWLVSFSGATPHTITTAYLAKYGAITALTDYKINYIVLAVNNVTGQSRLAGQGISAIVA